MDEITKEEAKAKGLKFYQSNKKCKEGHYCPRYVSNSACTYCVDIKYTKRKKITKEGELVLKVCKKGHNSPRYKTNGSCIQCVRERAIAYSKTEKAREYRKKWLSSNEWERKYKNKK